MFLIRIIYNKIYYLNKLIKLLITNKKNNQIINKKIKTFHNLLMILNINLWIFNHKLKNQQIKKFNKDVHRIKVDYRHRFKEILFLLIMSFQ